MIAKMDTFAGWEISARFEPDCEADRIKAVSWTASKEGETVTLEAPDLNTLKDLIRARSIHSALNVLERQMEIELEKLKERQGDIYGS